MNITDISANESLNLVNQTSHPDLEHKQMNYYRLPNGELMVHIYSGYGSFTSPTTKDEANLPKLEEELNKKYEAAKGTYKTVENNLLSFKI